jgi:hypothetical protein
MDNFCVLPFYSVEITHENPKNIYCCRLPQHTDIDVVRDSIRRSERHSSCAACWTLEDLGLDSERLMHNRTFDHYLDRDLSLIKQDALYKGFSPRIIKIATSNICNGTCVTCNSHNSSAWASLEKKKIIMLRSDVNELANIDWSQIVQLSFVGGEPLLEKKNFDILQNLLDQGNNDCFISLVTNGSIELSQKQFELLSAFKNLNVCFSIDATDRAFEYIRYPLKWSVLLDNLDKIRRFSKHVSISCMVSNLNLFYLDGTIDFFRREDVPYLCKQILSPDYFMPGNLPGDFKNRFVQQTLNNADEVLPFLHIGKFSVDSWAKCWQELHRQDSLKQINIEDYLPDFAATRIYYSDHALLETSRKKIDRDIDQIF